MEIWYSNMPVISITLRVSIKPLRILPSMLFTFSGVPVRLVGGSSYNEGRVEVNYNGEWGAVCDDGWSSIDAGVVCRQLGFGSLERAIYRAHLFGYGQGSGSIWLDGVTCTGRESTLARCGHLGVGVTRTCSHSEDAGVRCRGDTFGKDHHCI